jgi:hypothetical protein
VSKLVTITGKSTPIGFAATSIFTSLMAKLLFQVFLVAYHHIRIRYLNMVFIEWWSSISWSIDLLRQQSLVVYHTI